MRLWPKTKSEVQAEEIAFLRSQVAQLQNYILMTAPRTFGDFTQASAAVEAPSVGRKLYTSEIEEDVEWALQEGEITEERAKEILRDALEDVELQFD